MRMTLLLVVLLSGCALFEPTPKVGQPVVDPITGELRPATVDDTLAAIDRIDAELDVITQSTEAANTNPWVAGTGVAAMVAAMAEAKRRKLAAEKAKLLAELQNRNMEIPTGVELA